ncbi:MAG TPA: Flp pilus assembly protein CpaB [Sedimentisphaerales bacterium]|nr:Flp pilus assembly protein CpaB [Sedimentisphaerales bacterium]
MKWGILILVVLGVVAAACAALLVGAMGASSSATATAPTGFEVAVARRSLPAMTVVTLEHVAKQAVARNDLPQGQGQIANPTRIIGRVLSVGVVEGQVLTESCFVSEGTGAQLAAAIPEGMRAVTLSLSSKALPDRLLLYPGSVVDILFSFRLSGRNTVGEAGCLTILSGIQVLVVQGDSVVSNPEQEADAKARRSSSSGVQVTLLVDPKQAEALQVLADNGNISLTIRNPLDKTKGDMQTMVLSQGQLARLSSLLTAEGVAAPQRERELQDWLASQILAPKDANEAPQGDGTSSVPAMQPRFEEQYQSAPNPRWGVTVIRGKETKTEEFDVQTSESSDQNGQK